MKWAIMLMCFPGFGLAAFGGGWIGACLIDGQSFAEYIELIF